MDAAGKQGLGVILRVGYTWDYASPESALSRYEGLLYDPQLKGVITRYQGLNVYDRKYDDLIERLNKYSKRMMIAGQGKFSIKVLILSTVIVGRFAVPFAVIVCDTIQVLISFTALS